MLGCNLQLTCQYYYYLNNQLDTSEIAAEAILAIINYVSETDIEKYSSAQD